MKTGEKISPELLERHFSPCLPDGGIFIVSVKSADLSYDEIHAVIRDRAYTDEEKKAVTASVLKYQRDHLRKYPIKAVHFFSSIPYSSAHKLLRKDLARQIGQCRAADPSADDGSAFAFFLSLLKRYTNENIGIGDDDFLSSFGIDSLSLYRLASAVYEKYRFDFLPFLTFSTTIKDLKAIFSACGGTRSEITFRKLKKSEIRKAAALYADCMADYPLLQALYGESGSVKQCAFLEEVYLLYAGIDYYYTNDDHTVLFGIQSPKDKNRSVIPLFLNPFYTVRFLAHFKPDILRKVKAYIAFEDSLLEKHIDREKDCHIPIAVVREEYRSSGMFFQLLLRFRGSGKIWFETHSESDLNLYLSLGAVLVEKSEIFGVPFYLLRYDDPTVG